MKRISKDERKGAIALAIVVFLIVAATAWLRSCNHMKIDEDQPKITILYEEKNDSSVKLKSDSIESKKVKKNKKKESAKNSKRTSSKKTAKPSRDPLSDPIPLKH